MYLLKRLAAILGFSAIGGGAGAGVGYYLEYVYYAGRQGAHESDYINNNIGKPPYESCKFVGNNTHHQVLNCSTYTILDAFEKAAEKEAKRETDLEREADINIAFPIVPAILGTIAGGFVGSKIYCQKEHSGESMHQRLIKTKWLDNPANEIPEKYLDPFTSTLMKNPHIINENPEWMMDDSSLANLVLKQWPPTREPITSSKPDLELKKEIAAWLKDKENWAAVRDKNKQAEKKSDDDMPSLVSGPAIFSATQSAVARETVITSDKLQKPLLAKEISITIS